ncbi:MAG TPA: TlpA disulfide reductase family protein [Cyclobacteriaceae bacterium]|nr:TlpA disulfide reductase family protein [Cyclobacteriaceae bacterium]
MNNKDRSKKFILQVVNLLKPLALAAICVVLLQVTGLISSVSDLGNRAILMTGLKDASGEPADETEDFDFQFTIKDLKENKIPFDQFRGKVIFLNLWATWCGPCRAEMEGIHDLYRKVDQSKIQFVMLSIDRDADRKKVIDYISKKNFTFPTYMPSGYLPSQLKVPAIPTTFIISADGKVIRKEVGSMRYDTQKFQKFLEGLVQ